MNKFKFFSHVEGIAMNENALQITYRLATEDDAKEIVTLLNAAFYNDYIRYGYCPGYGRSEEDIKHSLKITTKYLVLDHNIPIGVFSYEARPCNVYYIGCLCIIPEYQGMGIGTKVFHDMKFGLEDWKRIFLVTPLNKEENVLFYTKKCGMKLGETIMDQNVKLVELFIER